MHAGRCGPRRAQLLGVVLLLQQGGMELQATDQLGGMHALLLFPFLEGFNRRLLPAAHVRPNLALLL